MRDDSNEPSILDESASSDEPGQKHDDFDEYRPMLFVVLVISGCSICYELIISAASTYLQGNSVLQ